MDGPFGWQFEDHCEEGYDAGHEDGYEEAFEDAEDEFLNSNDPLRKPNFQSAVSETSPGQTIAIVGAMLDDERAQWQASYEKNEDIEWEELDDDEDIATKYVSMSEHLSSGNKRPTVIGGSSVLKKRPFEQWVEDVLSGRKTYDDPL
jgi:hypothetical protein